MKRTSMTLVGLTVLFLSTACSQKTPHITQLRSGNESNINIRILDVQGEHVPKDKFFFHKSWHYQQHTHNKYNFFKNDEIVGTFYLAHHATHIYIQGTQNAIQRYRNYFLRNQVVAQIKLIPIRKNKSRHIKINYFSLNKNSIVPRYGKSDIVPSNSVKEVLKANSNVVEIPKSYIKGM